MRTLAVGRAVGALAVLGAIGAVGTAQAEKPTPSKAPKVSPGARHACLPHAVGYNASGTLVSAALTPTVRGRSTGTLTVTITKVNHRGSTGPATLTLTNAHVTFGPGVSATAPAAGSRVSLHGKITTLPKRCTTTGFTPTITVTHAEIRAKR